jgi:Family of unknown function (DUF5317)
MLGRPMLLLPALVAILGLTVPLAGGSLRGLGNLRLRALWLIWLALAVQVAVFTVVPEGSPSAHAAAYLGTYGLGLAFLVVNRGVPGMLVIGIGALLNLAAIVANGGQMPALPSALEAAGLEPEPGGFTNSVAAAGAPLWFLGDVFAVPWPWFLANVFSVGDVVIALGTAYGVHRVCGSRAAAAVARAARRVQPSRRRSRKARTTSR